jgi:hypothetical protein
VLLVVNVIASFTFFSLQAVEYKASNWEAKWRSQEEIRRQLEAINDHEKREVALVWMVHHALLPGPEPQQGQRELLLLLADAQTDEEAERTARIFASDVPSLDDDASDEPDPIPPIDSKSPNVSRAALQRAKAVVSRRELVAMRVAQSERSIIELIKTALGEDLPVKEPILKSFIKTFADEVVKHRLQRRVSARLMAAIRQSQSVLSRTDDVWRRKPTFVNSRRATSGCCLLIWVRNGVKVSGPKKVCDSRCSSARQDISVSDDLLKVR